MVAVIKPSFVLHEDDKSRPGTIFSLDVSPDGARLATAGLDQKIKVWSTEPVLDSDREADEEGTKKLLSTLGSHTGQFGEKEIGVGGTWDARDAHRMSLGQAHLSGAHLR